MAEVQGWMRRKGVETDPLIYGKTKMTKSYIRKMKRKLGK